jgi:hypothetical protein
VVKIQPLNLAPAELVEDHVCIHLAYLAKDGELRQSS